MRFFIALGLCVVLGFSACRSIEIKDGRIPKEHLDRVQPLLGTYEGEFSEQFQRLTLSLDGDRLVLKSENDLIRPSCRSEIGYLRKVKIKKKKGKYYLKWAKFYFDPNFCVNSIEGRKLVLRANFTDDGTPVFKMQILDHVEWQERCGYSCYGSAEELFGESRSYSTMETERSLAHRRDRSHCSWECFDKAIYVYRMGYIRRLN